MNGLIDFLQSNGLSALLVVTVLLGLGVCVQALLGNQLLKQRTGELTITCILLWIILAIIPMPRWDWYSGFEASESTSEYAPGRVGSTQIDGSPVAGNAAWIGKSSGLKDVSRVPLNLQLPAASPQFAASGSENACYSTGSPRSSLPNAWGSIGRSLVIFYLAGALLVVTWITVGYGMLARARILAGPASPRMRAIYEQLIPNGDGPVLRVANGPRTFISGLWCPAIVVSTSLQHRGSDEQVRCLLAHELAHWQQRDLRGRTVFNLVMPLLYFHPLYWFIRRQADLSAEIVADQIATRSIAPDRYVAALVGVVRQLTDARGMWASPACRGVNSYFVRRMQEVMGGESRYLVVSRRVQFGIAVAAGVVALLAASIAGTRDEPDQDGRLDQLRRSLHVDGQGLFVDFASGRLPESTIAYWCVDTTRAPGEHLWHRLWAGGRRDGQSVLNPLATSVMDGFSRLLDDFDIDDAELSAVMSGRVALAICSVDHKPASVLIVESQGRQAAVNQLINGMQKSMPAARLTLESIAGERMLVIDKGSMQLFVLPRDHELIVTDRRAMMQQMFSDGAALATERRYSEAKRMITNEMADTGSVEAFGFIRPMQFLNQSAESLQPPELNQILLGEMGVAAELAMYTTRRVENEWITECFVKTADRRSEFTSFLRPLSNAPWRGIAPAGLHGQLTVNLDWDVLLRRAGQLVNRVSGSPGSFQRTLDGLRQDPHGPQVDLAASTGCLGHAATLSWHFLPDETSPEWMLEIPVSREESVRSVVDNLLKRDHAFKQEGDLSFWVDVGMAAEPRREVYRAREFVDAFAFVSGKAADALPTNAGIEPNDRSCKAVAVYQGRLLIASSSEMLIAMTEETRPDRSLHSTRDFNRVMSRIVAGRSEPLFGLWFERSEAGLLGRSLSRHPEGWRIRSVLQLR